MAYFAVSSSKATPSTPDERQRAAALVALEARQRGRRDERFLGLSLRDPLARQREDGVEVVPEAEDAPCDPTVRGSPSFACPAMKIVSAGMSLSTFSRIFIQF